jgi:hypothetical protein
MALVRPIPPADVAQAFRAGLPAFLSGPDFGDAGRLGHDHNLGGIPPLPSGPDVGDGTDLGDRGAQQVFILGLHDLQSGAGTTAASLKAWRFFAGHSPRTMVAGDCARDARTGDWRLTNVSYGKRVWQMHDASNHLDDVPNIQGSMRYELRFLSIPGLHVEAFWLVPQSGGAGLAVIFPPPSQSERLLNQQPVYPMPAFLNIVSALAVKRLSFPDGPGGMGS